MKDKECPDCRTPLQFRLLYATAVVGGTMLLTALIAMSKDDLGNGMVHGVCLLIFIAVVVLLTTLMR